MFHLLGFLISMATFPGIIVHEIGHQALCRLMGIAVLDVKYFRLGNPSGYVIHEPARTVTQHVLIGVGPFLVNSLLGAIVFLPAGMTILYIGAGSFSDYFFYWLGLSIAMHAFPSVDDAKSLWHSVWGKDAPILARLLVTPLVGIIFLGALGSFFWLDLVYGVALVTFLPVALIRLLS